jgi:hypothetical protein
MKNHQGREQIAVLEIQQDLNRRKETKEERRVGDQMSKRRKDEGNEK